MVIDFYDVKGTYLTEVELSESDIKILVRYAILNILKTDIKKIKKNKQVNDSMSVVDKSSE